MNRGYKPCLLFQKDLKLLFIYFSWILTKFDNICWYTYLISNCMSYQKFTATQPCDWERWWNHRLGRYKTSPASRRSLIGLALPYSGCADRSGFRGSTSIHGTFSPSQSSILNWPSVFRLYLAGWQLLWRSHGRFVGGNRIMSLWPRTTQ